jgi:hypothetical protein
MMGNRGNASGIDVDAFSRKSRGVLRWRRGEIRKVKRAFSKRMRQIGRREARDA